MTKFQPKAPRPVAVLPEIIEDEAFPLDVAAPEAMETVIMARGVHWLPHPTETRVTGRNEDGTVRRAPKSIQYRPGCEIELPVSEAKRLLDLGTVKRPGEDAMVGRHPDLLVQPDRPEDPDPPTGDRGPVVSQIDSNGRITR
jgi:hypothetical protein